MKPFLQLFDTIRNERPNDLNKVIPICGDITSPELGISESDQVSVEIEMDKLKCLCNYKILLLVSGLAFQQRFDRIPLGSDS